MAKNNLVTTSPHFSLNNSTTRIMLMVLIALLPEVVASVVFFGMRALLLTLVSVASCVAFEFVFQKITKQDILIDNLSACVTGVLLALVCPSTLPLWMIVLGAACAIIVAKGLFGGIGANVFNPALTGRAVLFISFPASMGASWAEPFNVDVVSSATVLSGIKNGAVDANANLYLQYFLGNRAGCMGETAIFLIIISAIFLTVTKIIDIRAPLAMLATVVLCAFIAGEDVLLWLLTGGLLFGAVFMVTDYATAPVTKWGRIIFGIGAGLITFLIRKFGGYPEGVMFSILIMNAVAPFLNNCTGRMYGYAKKRILPKKSTKTQEEGKK